MVVVDADCKIVPDRIAGESDNLYVASLNIWTQVHKPLNHPIDVNRFIYPRIIFSDENDEIYTDKEYKHAHKAYYMREIRKDQQWYGRVYKMITNKYDMNGQSPEETVTGLIRMFDLQQECE